MRALCWLLLAAALAAAVAGCGRKGDLEHPPDSERVFPRSYPSG